MHGWNLFVKGCTYIGIWAGPTIAPSPLSPYKTLTSLQDLGGEGLWIMPFGGVLCMGQLCTGFTEKTFGTWIIYTTKAAARPWVQA